ncbi:GntR family transcriptional regulator [Burkholderia pseudomultivorans]|uniref:GntR family transcriptional regulator n=1 Tax=Burkholderia pseudomultivorans TaxID=1207504 RepID=A0A132EWS4_9BURK|nr:GntR family transcriptional regulator [Burkholderia pseudomultivorans]AOI90792.1 GntR family transcriptional regulator [Burkholderia pseudomultivorans]KWF60825.1 GntR family transcriptional regulator [Burkholderia pseudomultivorans]MDR8726837.1 HTH-type transcriptional repressor RspR [Burkholderia pseudomultivorans]MDR8736058.1 HTH-type transcriptional repressor RspR [Burkholderia pseudomultivorans]MDR8742034.1 HTH-type transcriptional repressor RspR [Burkholderia pseudomultivorans]
MSRQKLQPATADTESGPSADRKNVMAETLRRRIVGMELAPGAVVDELALSEEFGLSRPPVRELMRQMAAEGYLELEPNRPARVSPMSYQSLRSFFLAAPLLYVATTQLAASHATAEEVERLRQIQTQFRAAIDANDLQARVLHNDEFHFEIGRIARNAYLMPSLRRVLIDHARLGKIFYRSPATSDMQRDLETAVEQHDQIIDAIAVGDAQRAGELVRSHMELSRRRMTEYVIPEGLDVPIQL